MKKNERGQSKGSGETWKPLTRRQFLGRSTSLGFSFTTLSPFAYSLLHSKSVLGSGSNDPIPCKIIAIHLSGGWAGYHNFVPIDDRGSNINSGLIPISCGVPSNQLSISKGVFTGFGAPMWWKGADGVTPVGNFTDALYNVVSLPAFSTLEIIKNTSLVTIPNQSPDDNTAGAVYGITEAIASILDSSSMKPVIAHSVGLTNTPSGNGVSSFFSYPSIARLTPQSVTELLAVSQFSKSLAAQGATQSQLQAMANGLNDYVNARLAQLGTTPSETTFKALQQVATTDLMGRVSAPPGFSSTDLDPSKNALVTSLLGLNPASFGTSQSDIMWTAIYNTLQGAYAVCAFNLGGYDYHGTTAAFSDSQEAKAGAIVGKAIVLARILNTPTLIIVTSDGSLRSTGFTDVAPPTGTTSRWAGDDNNFVCSGMFLVRGGSVHPTQLQTQLGNVAADTGLSNTSSFVGNDKLATAAILANWASLNGLPLSVLDPVLQKANFSQSVCDNIKQKGICFG